MRKPRLVTVSRPVRFGLVTAAVLGLGACQALPPAVGTALVGFGQDVLAAAAQNFTPQYAASMENLFLAMAETATGMPFTEAADNGEQAAVDGEGDFAPGEYEDGGYVQEPYQEDEEAQYDQGQYEADAYQQGQYGAPQPSYDDGAHGPAVYGATAAAPEPHGAPAGIALEVALLAQELLPDGQVRLRPVQDGDVLHDGRGDPAAGDKIKIFFAANCACHVYVLGIDATGYVAKIFPDGNTHATSRVTPGAEYLVPGGTTWWGLDQYRGIEQVYFIASHERRLDIENLAAELAGRRPSVPANYRAVREPALIGNRGLVQVQAAAPTEVSTQYGAGQQVSPTLFQSTVADADLVITRWFRHE